MQPMVTIALRAARKAGELIMRSYSQLDRLKIETKQTNDYVTQVDKASEQLIIQSLRKAYPQHAIRGEESGLHAENQDSEYEWIIDPLDGTTNFIYGIPCFAISIACLYKGRVEHAVVFDPVRDEAFCASRGYGASLNECRIRVSNRPHYEGCLLATGIPFRDDQQCYADNYFMMLRHLSKNTAGIRRLGAAALDLAYVACGRFDGFWELGLHQWDIAAGALLITEAGGLIGDLNGDHHFLKTGNVVCGTPRCFKEMLVRIQPHAKNIEEKTKSFSL